jgi:hypothetical protein
MENQPNKATNVIYIGIFTSCKPLKAPKTTTWIPSEIWKNAATNSSGAISIFLGLYYMPHIINIYKKLGVNIGGKR